MFAMLVRREDIADRPSAIGSTFMQLIVLGAAGHVLAMVMLFRGPSVATMLGAIGFAASLVAAAVPLASSNSQPRLLGTAATRSRRDRRAWMAAWACLIIGLIALTVAMMPYLLEHLSLRATLLLVGLSFASVGALLACQAEKMR